MQENQKPQGKETDSDRLRKASVTEYIRAQAKPNGNGFKGFLHSNLFTALCIWILGQLTFFGVFCFSYFSKLSGLSEWRGGVDATLKRMDEQGTVHGHYKDETEDKDISELFSRMKRVEDDTRHIEVIESEHRRLTKDVEDLRNGRK